MRVWAVIPARYASTRFPGKVLAPLAGRPLLQHTWERVKRVPGLAGVLVAADDPRVIGAARGFGAEAVMTDPELPSGTDRVAAAMEGREADWVLNVQADEPLIDPAGLAEFVEALAEVGEEGMATLARRMGPGEDRENPNGVKVVCDLRGRALYFSRWAVPYDRTGRAADLWWHHVGVYAYRPETLRRLVALPPSPLERAESLEQLRALENGIAIRVIPTTVHTIGVDTPEDLRRVEALLET